MTARVPAPGGGGAAATERIAVAVAESAPPESLLSDVLRPIGFTGVVMATTLAEATMLLRTRKPALVVVPVDGPAPERDTFAQELKRHPETAAIATGRTKDADTVLNAMRAGILEFLVLPVTTEELRTAVHRVLQANARTADLGQVLTVFSAKGGLGVSTVAQSLAWALAQQNEAHRVALVDFTSTGAGARVMLNLQPSYDLASLASRMGQLDGEVLRSVMLEHPDGVAILAAADTITGDGLLDAGSAGRLIDLLRREFTYVVIDTDHTLNDQAVAALDAADRLLLVTHLDISALRSTQRSLDMFRRLGYPDEKIAVVLNRRADRDRIAIADAERVLNRPVAFTLPNEYEHCSDAITVGQFVQRFAPSSSFSAAMTRMAAGIGTSGTVRRAASNGSRLARFLGFR